MNINPDIKAKIISTANVLVAEGIEKPTNNEVRDRMGGGSLSHISPIMRQWRMARSQKREAALDIPDDLKKVIESSLEQVWVKSNQLASVSVEALKRETSENIKVITEERDEALAEISHLEQKVETLKKLLDGKELEVNQAKADLRKEYDHSSKMSLDNAVLETKIEGQNKHIATLTSELEAVKANNKKLQQELIVIAKQGGQ